MNPQNILDDLSELRALTGNAGGAQRVAWTDTWRSACAWLRQKLAGLPVEVALDEAGNTWATLAGASRRALVLGSHIDSVPNGGWLDGALGVLAGLEVLRSFAQKGPPPVTIRLVSWADEEGARFSHSLFGSSAATGRLNPADLAGRADKDGIRLVDALAEFGVSLERAGLAQKQLEGCAAYLELHIEQGPVLERQGASLAAVLGTLGVERHRVSFSGQTAHAGSTPLEMRRDALAAGARLALEIRQIARRAGGVGTIGSLVARPGIVTAVAGECECLLDQRHLDPAGLARMLLEARQVSQRIGAEEGVGVAWERLYQIEPIFFHPELVELCAEAVTETCGTQVRMPSGPLHDAAALARAGIPTAMLFVQSLGGLSHTREEDTRPADLLLAGQAFERLAEKTAAWAAARG